MRWTSIVTWILLFSASIVVAGPKLADGKRNGSPEGTLIRSLRYVYGRYEMPVTNDGRFGWDPQYNVPGGGRWPRGTGCGYIFGAGIWVGSMLDSVKCVTVGYNPLNIQTEMVPGSPPNEPGYTDPTKVVYVSTDYPNATIPPWPRGYDNNGLPITVSQMDSWSTCNDLDASHHFASGVPLGVLMTTETFSWSSTFRDVQDILFFRLTIKNINPDLKNWKSAYIGVVMDADIYDPTNDLTGCFPDSNIGFTYSSSQLTAMEKALPYAPGYVGVQMLGGPVKDPATGDAKMTTFIRWGNELVPNTSEERYDLLSKGTFDTLDTDPADKKMLLSNGPFDLAYGDSVQLVFAVVFAWPEWYYTPSILGQPDRYADHLKLNATNAKYIYHNNFKFPQPPDLPHITIVPDDRRLIVSWDNVSEKSIEPVISLPTTDPHNFEGYRLWKSTSGAEGTFTLLGDWDIVDVDDLGRPIGKNTGLTHSYVDNNLTNGKTYFYAVTAYNKGEYLPHHYGEDSAMVVPPLETGMTFGINLNAQTPGTPPSNYTAPGFKDFKFISGTATQASLTVTPEFLVRDSVRNQTYQISFKDPPSIRIDLQEDYLGPDLTVTNASTGDTVSVTLNFPITQPPTTMESDLFNGMKLSITGPNLLLDRIDSVRFRRPKSFVSVLTETDFSGNYLSPQTSVVRKAPLSFFFQPHTYLVQYLAPDQTNVYDVTTGEQLNYEVRSLGHDYAIASFQRQVVSVDPTTGDTTWTWVNNPTGFKRRPYLPATGFGIYVPGVFIFVQDPVGEIQAGDSLFITLSGAPSPRAGDVYQFSTSGSSVNFQTDLSVVKVVPNPYLVRAAWDLDNDYEHIQFINLPTQCTIKIYNIAGDLIQTIEHSEPYVQGFDRQTRGTAFWNLMTRNNQKVSTGVYIYYLKSPFGETIGRFAVIR